MRHSLFVALTMALVPAAALAIDGQVLINMSTVSAAGGFPYTINQAGSYKLSGNLTVPNGDTTAIVIAHDDVTLDLNGFSILAPVDCTAGFPCANRAANLGHGVRAGTDSPEKGYFNITVRNGTISGMGADGVHILGDNVTVEDLHVRNSGLSGIVVRGAGASTQQTALIVRRNTIEWQSSYGIKSYAGLITDNTVSHGGDGISVQVYGGIVSHNFVSFNAGSGLLLSVYTSYYGNTLVQNGAAASGGVNLGQNLCNGAVCP
jgi:hypothetical protein